MDWNFIPTDCLPKCEAVPDETLQKFLRWRGARWREEILSGAAFGGFDLPNGWEWFNDLACACQTSNCQVQDTMSLLERALDRAIEPNHKRYLLVNILHLASTTKSPVQHGLVEVLVLDFVSVKKLTCALSLSFSIACADLAGLKQTKHVEVILKHFSSLILDGAWEVADAPSLIGRFLWTLYDSKVAEVVNGMGREMGERIRMFVETHVLLFRITDTRKIQWNAAMGNDPITGPYFERLLQSWFGDYRLPSLRPYTKVKFSSAVMNAVAYAMRDSWALGCFTITDMTLLLGLLQNEDTSPFRILLVLNINPDRLLDDLREEIQIAASSSRSKQALTDVFDRLITQLPPGKRVMLRTEELLLGLLSRDSAKQSASLAKAGFNRDAVNKAIRAEGKTGDG